MMKTHCLWYFRGYIKDHNHVRKLILSCKLFVFSSPLALFFSFSLLSVDLSFRTLASLCFLKYVVRFILCLQTTPLPFTNSASLWKACRKLSLASFFFILFAFFFFLSSPVISEGVAVLKIHPSTCEWQRLLFHAAQHPPEWPWPEPPQLTSRL